MKMLALLTAGAVALTGVAPIAVAPAAAQRTVVTERTTTTTSVRHRGPGYNRHKARRCDWRYRNHHRVRVCRTVWR